jgi:integrase
MGQHLMSRPPKFVHGFLDRHGKPRFYFRRPGFKSMALPGLPWSPEFMAGYEEALAGHPAAIGEKRTKPGTMRALAVSYYNSLAFRSMRASSQAERRWVIERFCREHGDKSATALESKHVRKLIEAVADKPDAANAVRKALRMMMQHAIEVGLRDDDPTRDVKRIKTNSEGYHTWTEEEVEQFEAHHPIGSRARLALALLLYTGQRRGDVVRMGRQHLRDGALYVRQGKTGVELAIPVHQILASIIARTPRENLAFITTRLGQPFKPNSFSKWFRKQCDAAGLPHCSAHGLRKAQARRLAEAGCSVHEIAAITGHASLREVQRYTVAVDQKRLASSAMAKVKRGTSSGKLHNPFANSAKKR